MVRLSYRHIIKIIDLLEDEEKRLKEDKDKLTFRSPIDDTKTLVSGERLQEKQTPDIDRALVIVRDAVNMFNEEIEKVQFKFELGGIGSSPSVNTIGIKK